MNLAYPITWLAEKIVYTVIGLTPNTRLAEVVEYFIFDVIKIILLLIIILFVVSLIRSYLPASKIKEILSKRNKYVSHFLAALIGIITPFCSCSAVPLFLGFLEAGVPLGVTFSFLIASPMINEVALILLLSLFGWKIALLYTLSGLLIAIIAGIIIGQMKVDKLLRVLALPDNQNRQNLHSLNTKERLIYARNYTLNILKKIWLYILIGVALGAFIHGYVPADFLAQYAGADKWYAVPLAVLIGIPLYANAAGVIPLVGALTEKGVAIGTTLAFMMSVTALSLPEFMILKRVMKTKLILLFAGIVGAGIIFTGYIFNLILK